MTTEPDSPDELLEQVQALRSKVVELESQIAAAGPAEEARRLSEEKYRTLVEQSIQGVVIAVGPPPQLIFANHAMGAILGYTPEELQSLSPEQIAELVHPEDRDSFFCRFEDRLAGRPAPPHYEFRGVRKDGSVCWLEIRSARVDYLGKPAVQASFVDITERARATEALKESEERYRLLFEQSRDAISITTREGRYVDVNQSFLSLFGYSRNELMETSALDLYADPDDRRRFQEEIERSGSVRDYDLNLRKKDGTTLDCLLTATLRHDSEGRVVGYQGITRDVTERRAAERRLEALHDLGKKLLLSRDESQIASMAVDSAWHVLRYPVCGLWLVDEERQLLVRVAHRPRPEAPELAPLPLDGYRGITVSVVRSGKAVYLADVSKEPEYVDSGMAARSELCVPLRVGGKVIGALSAESKFRDGFDQNDERLLSVLADRAAAALENARLFETVRRSEKRYRTVLESSADAIVSLDRNLVVNGWSNGAERIFGHRRSEIVGQPHDLLVPEDARDANARALETARKQGSIQGWQTQRLAKSGRLVDVELSVTDLGELGYTMVLRDITDRKRAAAELRRLKDFNERIVQNMAEGIAVQDRDGVVEFMNPAALRLLGYELEDVRGMHWKKIIPEEHWASVEAADRRRERGRSDAYEVELACKDGQRIPVLVSGSPRHEDGAIVGTIAVFTDIGEHKRIQQELRESVERLRAAKEGIVQAMTATIEMRDPHTAAHQRRVAQLACAIAEEMGLSGERTEGIRMSALIHDIGKMCAPAEVLSKPGQLSGLELDLIRTHAQVGYELLKTIDFPWPVARIVIQHHEALDGSGYPEGLTGDDILLEARILGVADVVEAMSSHRPYRPALGISSAIDEISGLRGVRYDPQVVDACLRVLVDKGFKFREVPESRPGTYYAEPPNLDAT